ncbi:MAG: Nif3-like dinuclear metal center hexameric protein [Candidatus Roizmanbacteria bacterium]|nr:MAG: Nif3-like dinuclear metal center hexameric protein [Candidatus Roizmanbacteria bacterium]
MIPLDKLITTLNDILLYDRTLNLVKIDPYMPDGLQVKGNNEIKKIGFGVSASLDLFKMALENKCQALIVHHGLSLPPSNRYDALFQNRLSYLIENKISLFGYHFLMDSHPQIGHNVEIIKTIGGKPSKPYFHQGEPWGYEGEINKTLDEIIEILKPLSSPTMKIYPFGTSHIRKAVAVSGKGTPYPGDMQYLVDNDIDLYITGETSEWVRDMFKESQINFIAAGHYYSERFGLIALKKELQNKLSVEMEFLELVNEV